MSTRKKKRDKEKTAEGAGGGGETDDGSVRWFNPQPTAEDLRELEGEDYDPIAGVVALFNELPSPDRITSKYDVQSGRFLAIYFRSPVDNAMPMEAMSVRGATALDACILLAYFHLVKFAEEWGGGESELGGRFG